MFYELIATIAAGFVAAGIALILGRAIKLPRWAIPVAAGAAMLGFSIWSEYTWADRTIAGLPEGFETLQQVETQAPWQPWTYLVPRVVRFSAVDASAAKRNPDLPDLRLADIYLFARWQPVVSAPMLVDCAATARAEITSADALDGNIPPEAWIPLPADDPLLQHLCVS